MEFERLRLIVTDAFVLDTKTPHLKDPWFDFNLKKSSYTLWAVDELLSYLKNTIYNNRISVSISFLISAIEAFSKKMEKYIWINPKTAMQFKVAKNVCDDICALLHDLNQ